MTAERLLLLTASARIRPDLTCGATASIVP